jgi:hypothetical protein
MAADKSNTAILKSLMNTNTKTFTIFDGGGRAWKVYQAPSEAKDGTPCLLTEYIYTAPMSSIILGTKEVESVWDGSWDASFTV